MWFQILICRDVKPYFKASLLREVAPPIVFKAVTEGVTS